MGLGYPTMGGGDPVHGCEQHCYGGDEAQHKIPGCNNCPPHTALLPDVRSILKLRGT